MQICPCLRGTQETATAMEGGEWGGARAQGFRPRNYISQKDVLHTRWSPDVRATLVPRGPLGNGVRCLRGTKVPGNCSSRPVRAGALSHGGRQAAPLWWSLAFCGRQVGSLAYPSVRRSICPSAPGSVCRPRSAPTVSRWLSPRPAWPRAPPGRSVARRWGVSAAWAAGLLLSLPGPDLGGAQGLCDRAAGSA